MVLLMGMGISERRERERLAIREQILDAARYLFNQRGYESVTMREIAKRIEYSATALYHHFADKETLVRELCRRDFTDFAGRFLVAVARSENPLDSICRAGLVYLEFAQDFPQHYRIMFMTPLPETSPEEGERDDPQRNAYIFLRQLMAALMEGNYLRPDVTDIDLASQTAWAMLHGAAALELTIASHANWLDFKPREERFAAAMRTLVRSMMRDPHAGELVLARVLKGPPQAGPTAVKSKKTRAKAPTQK